MMAEVHRTHEAHFATAFTLSRRRTVLFAVLGALLAVHFFQIFSPMRLDLDSIGYLNRTVEIVDGENLGPTWFPPAYSYMLAGLDFAGLGDARAFATLNFLFLCLGLFCVYQLLQHEFGLSCETSLVVSCLFLLSFVLVKYAALPIADTSYFGISMAVLLLSLGRREWGPPAATLVLIAAGILVAILTRAVGVTLAAALVGATWRRYRMNRAGGETARQFLRARIGFVVATAVLTATAVVYALTSSYLDEVVELYGYFGFANEVSSTMQARLRNWGELAINAPFSVLPSFVHGIAPVAGIAGIALVLYGIYLRRSRWGPTEAYFVAFLVVLLIYPGDQTRYWLPVLPLMMGWAAVAVRQFVDVTVWKAILGIYLLGYTITGVGALYYSTSITLSGSEMGHAYGDGTLTYVYDAAFEGRELTDDDFENGIHEQAYLHLRRFEPRAQE